MTDIELIEERVNTAMLAMQDDLLFGTSCVEKWIDEDGNARSKHIPIAGVFLEAKD